MLLSVVLACRVFALSCQYICAIVVVLFALSWVISVQQFTKFLRFRYSSVSFNPHTKTVWFSFRWISASSSGPSNDATPLRVRSPMCSWRCGRDRSGWRNDSGCTTSHLCGPLHTSPLTTRRCPGLECWTCVQDDISVNHLYTADRTLTRFTNSMFAVDD